MLDKLKKVLGFGNSDDDDQIIADDPEFQTSGNVTVSVATGTEPGAGVNVETLTADIFEHVLVEFNKALPDFLKDSVDRAKQKQYLYDTLSSDIRSNLKLLEEQTNARINRSWSAERERLQADLKSIRENAKDIESKRAELKQQQLSSDRQRRALSERVKDLEKQILSLEADKEQLELETKSMLNKVKVAQVYEKDCEAMREQIAHLQSELNKARLSGNQERTEASQDDAVEVDPGQQAELQRLHEVEKEYNSMIDRMKQVEEQINQVEQVVALKDERIKELTSNTERLSTGNKDLTERLLHAEKQLKTVTEERDKALAQAEQAKHKADTNAEKSTTAKINTFHDDDDIVNDTDWIVNPKSPHRRNQQNEKTSKNKKQNNREDDPQMSLW